MSDVAIRVENLAKQYRLGRRERYRTFRESINRALVAPFRLFRKPSPDDPTRSFWALRDVSFDVQRGEVIGIIGRNGAGKSTLLKILSRITEPTSGRVEIHGRVGSLLEVGTGFHPELTGRENVFLNGAILGMKRWEITSKFDEIVAFAEVDQFLDTPVKHYSSGMYTRLAFAVAAHLEPEILVVDEVLAVGDAGFQKKCLGKMGDVARHGRTVLFVSHNMAAISNLCSRTIVMAGGEVMTDGPCDVGIAAYTRSFREDIGSSLHDRKDRQGAGRVQFTRVRYEDERSEPLELGISGQSLTIALEYGSADQNRLTNLRASIKFSDAVGQLLFLCSSELTTHDTIECPPNGTLRCVIPKLPLSGGEYYLTIFIEVNGEVQDVIENAATLTVEDGDFYGTGRLYPPGWQGKGILVPHSWDTHQPQATPVVIGNQRTQ